MVVVGGFDVSESFLCGGRAKVLFKEEKIENNISLVCDERNDSLYFFFVLFILQIILLFSVGELYDDYHLYKLFFFIMYLYYLYVFMCSGGGGVF